MTYSPPVTRYSSRRRDIPALLAMAGVWLLFFWRLFTPSEADRMQLTSGDLTQQFLVFRQFALDEFRQGRWPLWMPCIDSGYPYLADPQSATFYPPMLINTWLHVALGAREFSILALEWEAALHVLLAALLMYGFLQGEVRRRSAAVIGALTFAFGGFLTGYPLLQVAILESAAWLPVALWAARRLATRGDARSIALLALPLALSILAGHPQTYTFIFYLATIYFIYKSRQARMSWRGVIVRWLGAVALALALSAVQLVPAFEYARLSSRVDLSFDAAGSGLPLADILQFVVANVVSHFNPLYVGILPLALVFAAIGSRRRQTDTIFWFVVAVGGLLISFGNNLAIFDGLYWFAPGYQVFRDQERHALIVTAALSVVSAYGADAFLQSVSRRSRKWLRSETRWLSIGLLLLFVALAVTLYLSGQGVDLQWADPIALAVIVAAFTVGVFAARLNGLMRQPWLPIVMVAVVAFDLASANRAVNWVNPYDPFPAQPALEAIKADAPSGVIFRLHNEQRLPGHMVCVNGLNEVGSITPIHIDHYNRFTKTVPREVRWQLLNVRYVVTYRSMLDGSRGQPINATLLAQQGEGKDAIYTYRLNDNNPRAWIVHEVQVRSNVDDIDTALSDPNFNARGVAYTQTPIEVVTNQALEPVSITTLGPTRSVIDATLTTPGVLVLSEVNYPGWSAIVNGVEVPIIEVDGVLRGVALPSGPSRVEMIFRPTSVLIGGMVSVIGIVVCIGLIVWRRRGVRT